MRAGLARTRHLVRRFFGSLSTRPPAAGDEAWAEQWLLPGEVDLWRQMGNPDRRHAMAVARRFETALGRELTRPAMAAALLHDVGKVQCGLGTIERVVATVLGPRFSPDRYACYHRHEELGAGLCAGGGSDPLTVALVRGDGAPPALLAALHAADDV
jgi:hypothetical protein